MTAMIKAAVFIELGRIELTDKPIPDVDPNDALVRITTTICRTNVHILKGEYPVANGLTVGHEVVGVLEKIGSSVQSDTEGQRVIAVRYNPTSIHTPHKTDRLEGPQLPSSSESVRLPWLQSHGGLAFWQSDPRHPG